MIKKILTLRALGITGVFGTVAALVISRYIARRTGTDVLS